MIFVSGLHIVIAVIFPFELLGLGERIHTLGFGKRLLDPVSKINELIKKNIAWIEITLYKLIYLVFGSQQTITKQLITRNLRL